jgi:hypothetical protein
MEYIRCTPNPVVARSKLWAFGRFFYWDCAFEPRWGYGRLSVVSIVCCQIEVSAMS